MTPTLLEQTEQFRPEFYDHWETEYQQVLSRTNGLFDSCTVTGQFREFPLLAKTTATRMITKRFEETAPDDITTGKRRVTTNPYICPIGFDRVDLTKFGTLESPIGPTIQNQRSEAERQQDETVIGEAGKIGGLIGQAIQVDANGVVSYPAFDDANYTIPVNYDYTSGATGSNKPMSYDKLTFLREKLGKLNVRSQDSTTNNPSGMGLLLGYSQVTDLIQDTKLRNRDEASALLEQVQEGAIVDVLGFTIRAIADEFLPYDSVNDIRTCIAFAKRGVKFGYNNMPHHELDVLPGKTHMIQSVFYWDWGMARIWDQAVWKVPCQEA